MFSNKNYEPKKGLVGSFLRSFHKVMRDKNLTLLRKLILCDVISRKIKGKPYYKTSLKLAEEMGAYEVGTIQKNFQWLDKNGYINTQPYNDGSHKDDLREVEVIQMEQWIYTDEYLESINFKVLPIVKKDKNQVPNWNKKRGKKKTPEEITPVMPVAKIVEQAEVMTEPALEINLSIKPKKVKQDKGLIEMPASAEAKAIPSTQITNISDLIVLDAFNDIERSDSITKSFIEKISRGEQIEFIKVNVEFKDKGIGTFEDEATLLPSGKYVLKSLLKPIKKRPSIKKKNKKSEF